jgi:curved DNA-binding protein
LFGGAGVEDLFGGLGGQRGKAGGVQRPTQQAEVTVNFHEAVRGTEKELSLRDSDGERTIRVRIPAGVKEGGKVRLRGQGALFAAGDRGDLVLTVRVMPHPYYRREGDDLHVDVPVTLGEAYRGGSVTVPTPDGQVSLKVPKGVKGGTKLRLRGRGVPRRDGSVGDLYAHVQVRLPAGQNADLDRLFDELDGMYGEESIRKDLE